MRPSRSLLGLAGLICSSWPLTHVQANPNWQPLAATAVVDVLSTNEMQNYGFSDCDQAVRRYKISTRNPDADFELLIKSDDWLCKTQPFPAKAAFAQVSGSGKLIILHQGTYTRYAHLMDRGGKRRLSSLQGPDEDAGTLVSDGNHIGIRFKFKLVHLLTIH